MKFTRVILGCLLMVLGMATGAGEGYYMQYVCAGKLGDVISMQVANT